MKVLKTTQRSYKGASRECHKKMGVKVTNENKTARARHYFSVNAANVAQVTTENIEQTQAVRHADKLMDG